MNRRSANTRQAGHKPPQELPLRIYEVAKELSPSLDIRTGIQRSDWDFHTIPEENLLDCMMHEFARESATLHRFTIEPKQFDYFALFEATFTRHHWAGTPARLHLPYVEASKSPGYKSGTAQPWNRSLMNTHGIVTQDSQKEPEILKLRTTKGHFVDLRVFNRRALEIALCGSGERYIGQEWMVIRVNWAECDDKMLKNSFTRWLKDNRPKSESRQSLRGVRKKDMRAALHWLGAMRLMSVMPMCDAIRLVSQLGRPDNFTEDEVIWRQRKSGAERRLRDLFPGIPRNERPLSASTYRTRLRNSAS